MPIIGIDIDKTNPRFTIKDFMFWMPQFRLYLETEEGILYFNKLKKIANNKIFASIYGTDWEMAMCYCIAHYLTLIAQQTQSPSGATLSSIAGGGVHKGILEGASIGGFNKSLDFSRTMVNSEESYFWNQTSYGASLMAIYKTKAVASIFVIQSDSRGYK